MTNPPAPSPALPGLSRLTDFLVEDILETPADEILAEYEEDHGGAEQHVTRMRALVKEAVEKANLEKTHDQRN